MMTSFRHSADSDMESHILCPASRLADCLAKKTGPTSTTATIIFIFFNNGIGMDGFCVLLYLDRYHILGTTLLARRFNFPLGPKGTVLEIRV